MKRLNFCDNLPKPENGKAKITRIGVITEKPDGGHILLGWEFEGNVPSINITKDGILYFGYTIEELKAIAYFSYKHPACVPPRREDGSINYELIAGEWLFEGHPEAEVRHHYESLPESLKK